LPAGDGSDLAGGSCSGVCETTVTDGLVNAEERKMDQGPRCVFVASGELHADQVRAFLGAAGITTAIRGESVRRTHGFTADGLGAVEILVADTDFEHARALIGQAEAGRFRLGDNADVQDEGGSSSTSDD
jgi:hypothetical protein